MFSSQNPREWAKIQGSSKKKKERKHRRDSVFEHCPSYEQQGQSILAINIMAT